MKNLILITNLKQALDTNNTEAGAIAFYRNLTELNLIEQYYWLKGFKMANEALFYEVTSAAKATYHQEVCDIIINILNNIHNFGQSEQDYQAAYNGLGNIEAYVTQIEKVFPKI